MRVEKTQTKYDSLLRQHGLQFCPLAPPDPIEINIQYLQPILLVNLVRHLPVAPNPCDVDRDVYPAKPLHRLRNTAFDRVSIGDINLDGLDLDVRVLLFNLGSDGGERGAVAVGQGQRLDAGAREREGCCATDACVDNKNIWSASLLLSVAEACLRCIFSLRLGYGGDIPEPAPVRKAVPFNNVAAAILDIWL